MGEEGRNRKQDVATARTAQHNDRKGIPSTPFPAVDVAINEKLSKSRPNAYPPHRHTPPQQQQQRHAMSSSWTRLRERPASYLSSSASVAQTREGDNTEFEKDVVRRVLSSSSRDAHVSACVFLAVHCCCCSLCTYRPISLTFFSHPPIALRSFCKAHTAHVYRKPNDHSSVSRECSAAETTRTSRGRTSSSSSSCFHSIHVEINGAETGYN